jgi:nitrate reductase gamma subunit
VAQTSERRELAICVALFLLGFIPVAGGVIAFLLPKAHGPARYTFTGSPPVDAVLIGLMSGAVIGLMLVGLRRLSKGQG